MFTLQTSFRPILVGEGGGGVKSGSKGTVKEENSWDFCPNYAQESGFSPHNPPNGVNAVHHKASDLKKSETPVPLPQNVKKCTMYRRRHADS